MKYTIEGFSQEYALTLQKEVEVNGKTKRIKVDCNDLVILRWFVDFYPKMMKVEIDGKQYAWIKYQALLEDLPLLDIKKRMLFDRLQKLVDFGILSHQSIKSGGSYSYYGFGENYINLIDNSARTGVQKIADGMQKNAEGMQNIAEGVCNKLQTGAQKSAEQIDSSIKNPSIKDPSIIKGKDIAPTPPEEKKFKIGNYNNVSISHEEITKLSTEFGEEDTKQAIEYLSEEIEFKGYKAKSHYLAIRRWVIDAVRERRIKAQELAQREKRAKEIEAKQKAEEGQLFNGKRLIDLTQAEYEEYMKTQKPQAKPKIVGYNWLTESRHNYSKEQLDSVYDGLEDIEA